MKHTNTIKEFTQKDRPLTHVELVDQIPLPPPFDKLDDEPEFKPLKDAAKEKYECLDDTIALNIPIPETKEEEERLVNEFLSGLTKLYSRSDNWTFLQQLVLSTEHCAKCLTCSDACHIYIESGENPLYRPSYRSEILRRIYFKYVKKKSTWTHGDIDLNWKTVARLIELSYRCNVCRRCAQTCPIGVDNALMAREIRKIASQEMGLTAKELHENGSMLQLKVGSSTGINDLVAKDNLEFIDEDTAEKTGVPIETPWDVEGADILLIHNAGEIMSWPENVGAFATIFNAAGLSWTMSSALAGFDSINYGVWYDDVQFARVALLHAQAARKLDVKKIVLGECGHAHKALTVIADKILTGDLNIPRESCLPILRDIVMSGKIKFDKSRNDFPVTLHDPCNYVRLMGIVEPQREIIREIVPEGRFREMTPHGVDNYCCGGGSGFAIMSGHNFADWRHHVSGRRKFRQVLEAFQDVPMDKEHPKYICAPCYISVQDRDFRISDTSGRFRADFGDGKGDTCYSVYKHRSEPCFECPVAKTFDDGLVHQSEEVVTNREGSRRNVLVYTAPIRNPLGDIESVMEMSTDITDLRQLQSRLTSLGMLVGSISHGIKGLLSGLDGGIYMLETGLSKNKPERLKKGLDMVERNAERIRNMVLNILYYAKDRPVIWDKVDTAELTSSVADILANRASQLGVKLEIEGESGLVECDRHAVNAMLVNLIENSLDACNIDKRDIEHKVSLSATFKDDQVVFTIKDNGIGMDRETRDKAFSLFFSSKGAAGTGLGLFIAQKIVNNHQGTIRIKSIEGEGTSFIVSLPLVRPPQSDETVPLEEQMPVDSP